MAKPRNLWPKTVLALTLAGIDPQPVSVLGLTDEGYYTFVLDHVDVSSFATGKTRVATNVVTDEKGEPIREFHQWPNELTANEVMAAFREDLEANAKNWLDRLED